MQLPVGLVDRVATHVLAPEPVAAAASPPLILLLRRSAAVAAAVLLLLGGIYVGRMPRGAWAADDPTHVLAHARPALERALALGRGAANRRSSRCCCRRRTRNDPARAAARREEP